MNVGDRVRYIGGEVKYFTLPIGSVGEIKTIFRTRFGKMHIVEFPNTDLGKYTVMEHEVEFVDSPWALDIPTTVH